MIKVLSRAGIADGFLTSPNHQVVACALGIERLGYRAPWVSSVLAKSVLAPATEAVETETMVIEAVATGIESLDFLGA